MSIRRLTPSNRRGAGGLFPFSPVSLGGNVLWLRADMGITVSTGVSTWADQSGNGHNAVQATSANQPTFSATGAPNGKPCLTGNGTTMTMATAGFTLNQPWELFLVAKYGGGTTGTLIDGVTINKGRVWQFAAGSVAASSDGGTNYLAFTGTLTNWTRINVQWNTTTSAATWLSTAFTQGAGTGVGIGNPGGLTIFSAAGGATDLANASIAEIIAYSPILTTGQRASVQNYLKNRYGI